MLDVARRHLGPSGFPVLGVRQRVGPRQDRIQERWEPGCLGTYTVFILHFVRYIVQHLGEHTANELAAFDVEFIFIPGVLLGTPRRGEKGGNNLGDVERSNVRLCIAPLLSSQLLYTSC